MRPQDGAGRVLAFPVRRLPPRPRSHSVRYAPAYDVPPLGAGVQWAMMPPTAAAAGIGRRSASKRGACAIS